MELRYYQQEAWDAIQARLKAGHKGAAVSLPTGSGKTFISAMLADMVSRQKDGMMLLLTEREKLLTQAHNTTKAYFPHVNMAYYGFGKHGKAQDVLLGGVQTLSRPNHLEVLSKLPITLINIDEAHHSASDSYRHILNLFPDAIKIGQSATFFRHDGLDLLSLFDCSELTYKVGMLELIEKGYLPNILIASVKTRNIINNMKSGGEERDFNEAILEQAVNRPDRNTVIAQTCAKEEYGGPTIPSVCFAVRKAHAHALVEAFTSVGIIARAVIDTISEDECTKIYEAFAKGEIHMLVTVGKLIEGWDGNVWRIVNAAPTKSPGRFIQKLGRGTRTAPGKTFCWLLDFTDDSDDHSFEPLTAAEVLGLPELVAGGDVAEAIKARQERGEEVPGINNDDDQSTFMGGEIVVREKPAQQTIDWSIGRRGDFITAVGNDRVVIYPSLGGKYNVHVARYDPQAGKRVFTLKEEGKSLGYAQMMAEAYAKKIEKGYGWTLDSTHPRYQEPITPGQIKELEGRFRFKNVQGWSRGRASEMLDKLYNSKKRKAS